MGRWQNRPRPAGVFFGILLLALAGLAFATGNNLLFLMLSATLAFGVVSGFLSRLVLAGLELELLLPEHVSARMPAAARVRVRNLKFLTPSFSIELSGRPAPDTGTPPILARPVYFPLIPGRATLESAVEVEFSRRGRHLDNLFILSTSFPFGFVRKSVQVPLHRETIVYPSLSPAPGAELLLEQITGEIEALFRGRGLDFQRIRPWESGDTARSVDWKSTAHTGVLQVREFSREDRKRVEIYLDRRVPPGGPDSFEHLLEVCAYLVWRLADGDTVVTLRTDGHVYAIPADGDVYGALRLLALLEPGGRCEPVPAAIGDAVRVALTSHPGSFAASARQPLLVYTGRL